ncbi:MAG: TldD/PmbA family protein [Planctomycetota bacterium]
MKEILSKALEKVDAEYADIRYEDNQITRIIYAGKELKGVSFPKMKGGHIRVLKNGGWGTNSFNEPSKINKSVKLALEAATGVGNSIKKKVKLAPAPVIQEIIKVNPKKDPRKISFDQKKQLLERYNEMILSHPKIKTTNMIYREEYSRRYFINTDGTYIDQEILIVLASIGIVAKEGNLVQAVGVSVGGCDDYSRIEGREKLIEEKTKAAIDLLSAEPVKAGSYMAVINPDLAGVFIHEAFGHMSEADSIMFNPSMRQEMKIGRRLSKPILNVVDNGSLPDSIGSYRFDDEGIASRKTYLIKEGVLNGRLHSRETAAEFNEPLSGNTRAADYQYTPIVRMSNIFIENGTSTFDEMISSIQDGLYLIGGKGGQTVGDVFTFGAQYGYIIKNGRLTQMIRDINLSGNLFTTLMSISAIGNDLKVGESGGCGKGGQMLTGSGYGSPHIKIDSLTIGGR